MAAPVAIRLLPKARLPLACALILSAFPALAADPTDPHKVETQAFFKARVTPFLNTYCIACHQNKTPTRGGVNFSPALKDPGHPGFADKYLAMLKAGGTLRHQELLAPFGLDASDPGFWRRGLDIIAGFIDELEAMS